LSVNDVFKIKKNAVGIPPGSLEYTGIYKDEKIKIVLGGLKDINGLIIKDKIILEYGYIYK